MSVYIQDGRRGGHLRWATQAVSSGLASGVVISAFHTPRIAIPRHQAGATVAASVAAAGGEAIFDASTHALLLPSSDDRVHYDTWQMWGPSGEGLSNDNQRLEHLERVFAHQRAMKVSLVAPTQTLDSPLGAPAGDAFRTAQLARGIDRNAWQTLAARRSFWRSGADLDAYVGQLASLRAPCWLITVVNDMVIDNIPDLADREAFSGLLRTVHSLSTRARVILCHADYAGLPAVAAGASGVGAGWDRGMRYFDPRSFQQTTAGIQIPASYVTQGRLGAVLRRDTGDAISRINAAYADTLRGGPLPPDDTAERSHHLRQLTGLVGSVVSHGNNRQQRVLELRNHYQQSKADFDNLLGRLPKSTLQESSRVRWVDQPYAALKHYAEAEGLW